ncbi:LysR family transcriptional regulator [Rhodobacteraceae bacterium N5(2021)]|uniref:LysR family transcriptional regulator n=2 Tax=Gymnodinialimonas phycosphaerae TaxID=2841589 RepID=A0A975TX20_9RHOB|nr:LysR family transcriptional regulator [Gymnodinialimonas phycosphaerae]MBY4892094.1 LysR family transcriptional regulator [Gymnodinialimonas phycosphaerae]
MTYQDPNISPRLPGWVPEAALQYLAHVAEGQSLRDIAKETGQAPSTISRRIRHIESRRDDPLIDEALSCLAEATRPAQNRTINKEMRRMTAPIRTPLHDEAMVTREARRILRRLCETGAVLAVAQDMDKAVVLRQGLDGDQTRTAVVDRRVAQAFAVKDWISCVQQGGKLARYAITTVGKTALKRLLDEDRKRRMGTAGFAEGPTSFQGQHADWGTRSVAGEGGKRERLRVNLSESPLAGLARRKGSDGKPFLGAALVQVGERLREDFERAQMGPRVGQNWDRFLSGSDRGGFMADGGIGEGPRAARARVSEALDALGPGLGDVVMRVCCFLEGLESAEKRLGWSARSGKVVLKIGLQRLLQHYEERHGFVPAQRD